MMDALLYTLIFLMGGVSGAALIVSFFVWAIHPMAWR